MRERKRERDRESRRESERERETERKKERWRERARERAINTQHGKSTANTARQTFVRAAAGLARVLAVSSAKNQARSGKHLPATVSSCVDPQTAQRTHVSSTHTRTVAGTHLKTRRIVRLFIITLHTSACRRISAHPRPPTRPIGKPLRPFFEISFQTVWTMVRFSTALGREFYAGFPSEKSTFQTA